MPHRGWARTAPHLPCCPRATSRTPKPLINNRQVASFPVGSDWCPVHVVPQPFRYLISSDLDRSIPVDCLSFAPHKRHLVLCSLANLLAGAGVARKPVGQCPGDQNTRIAHVDQRPAPPSIFRQSGVVEPSITYAAIDSGKVTQPRGRGACVFGTTPIAAVPLFQRRGRGRYRRRARKRPGKTVS